MILSLPREIMFEYVIRQVNAYFPDECVLGGTKRRLIWRWNDWITVLSM